MEKDKDHQVPKELVSVAYRVANEFARWQSDSDQAPDEPFLNALHDLCDVLLGWPEGKREITPGEAPDPSKHHFVDANKMVGAPLGSQGGDITAEMKEYRDLFFGSETSFRAGYMAGISDAEIAKIGNKPYGESGRWEQFSSSLKSWDPSGNRQAPEGSQGEGKGKEWVENFKHACMSFDQDKPNTKWDLEVAESALLAYLAALEGSQGGGKVDPWKAWEAGMGMCPDELPGAPEGSQGEAGHVGRLEVAPGEEGDGGSFRADDEGEAGKV